MSGEGAVELQHLREGGFAQPEIDSWAEKQKQQLTEGGFNQAEIDEYFGKKPFNDKPLKDHFEQTISAAAKANQPEPGADGVTAPPKPFSFTDALEAGWQNSVTGLMSRGKAPDKALPADNTWYQRLAFSTASIAGDVPAMIGGAVAGGAGGAETGPGAIATAAGGAFAMPAALRATMMDSYTKGEFHTPGEFVERAGGIMLDTAKAWVTGAAVGLSGGAASAILPEAATVVGSAARAGAVTTGQVATMATVSKAMEGELPKAQDFIDAALVVGAFHGVSALGKGPPSKATLADTAQKLRDIYAQTNTKPETVLAHAQQDPTILQDLLSTNKQIPTAYEQSVDPMFKKDDGSAAMSTAPAAQISAPASPTAAAQSSTALASGTVPATPVTVPPKTAATPPAGASPMTPEETILSKVQVGGKTPTEKMTFDKMYTYMVDDLHPIKAAVDKMTENKKILGADELTAAENPYILARLTRGAAGRADAFLTQGTFDYGTLANNGKSLKGVLAPVKSDLDGLRAFLVSQRVQELDARGIKHGFDMTAANDVVKNGQTKYAKVAGEVQDYQNNLTKYLRDSGVIGDDTYKAMLQGNKNYVPFYRVFADDVGGPGGTGKGTTTFNPIKMIKGSDNAIVDPIESMIKNTYAYTALADRNEVGKQFVSLAKDNMPDMAKKIKPTIMGTEVSDAEMTKFLQSQGINDVPQDLLTIFRAKQLPLEDNQIAVYEGGKRSVYELPSDVAAAFKAADRETAGWLFKLIAAPTKFFRAGVTLSPDFFPRNIIRDQFDALINSRNGFVPVLDTVRGAASLVAKDADYQNWLKSGGANAALVSLDRNYLQSRVFKLNTETGDWLGKTWNVVRSPLDVLRVVSELAENSTRLGEFKKAYKSNIDQGFDPKASAYDAGYQSREVTLDFARTGAKTRALNQIIAFWNAQIQGADRIARRVAEDPINTSAKIAASIALPSILLWYANKDDPRVQDAPDWQKDMFWLVPTDKWRELQPGDAAPDDPRLSRLVDGKTQYNQGVVYRIPKPHELGVLIGSSIERFLDYTHQTNPHALKNFASDLAGSFMPGTVPTVAQPIIEQFANKSMFTGAPIVPNDAINLLPEMQYNAYTTETAKALGKMIGSVPYGGDSAIASPAIIENYVRQWSGGLGMYALQIADAGLRKSGALPDPVQPASTLADIPIIKAFVVRNPSAGTQPIQDFYSDYISRKKVVNTVKFLSDNGDPVAAYNLQKLRPNAMIDLNGVKEGMSNAQQFIKLTQKNPDMKPVEKRQLIDTAYYQMNMMAKQGNATIREIDSAMGK